MQELVDDVEKFEKVQVKEGKDYSFMTKQKKDVDDFLAELVDKQSLTEYERHKLSPDGPKPARLYGLPKIHKPLVNGLPKYRPIMSQIGSPTYKIAKFLLSFIQPFTSNEYTVKDTFHFVSMLDGKDHRLIMASLVDLSNVREEIMNMVLVAEQKQAGDQAQWMMLKAEFAGL